MKRTEKFSDIEKRLTEKFSNEVESRVFLEKTDFKEGKLTASGYNRLKEECEYIGYSEDIEINIPEEHFDGFYDSLERFASREISLINKDKLRDRIISLLCLIVGISCLAFGQIFSDRIAYEITLVASWVFLWTAFEKFFFEQRGYNGKKYSILHILSAKTIACDRCVL